MRSLLLFLCLFATPVLAQDIPDAGLPDAAVGGGGADMNQEENDDPNGTCITSNECDRGFECLEGTCTPTPTRNAGCSVGGSGLVGLAALLLTATSRSARRRR